MARSVSAHHADGANFRPIPRPEAPFRSDLGLERPSSGKLLTQPPPPPHLAQELQYSKPPPSVVRLRDFELL